LNLLRITPQELSKKQEKMMNIYTVIYSIYDNRNGDIIVEAEEVTGFASNNLSAQTLLVHEIRKIFPESEWKIVIHQVIEHMPFE
jgi:hypothetical protein